MDIQPRCGRTGRTLARKAIALLLSGCFCLGAASGIAAAPKDFVLPSVPEGEDFRLESARGRVVALHFLVQGDQQPSANFVRTLVARMRDMAGVEHVFIRDESLRRVEVWRQGLMAEPPVVHRDEGGALAQAYGVPEGLRTGTVTVRYPATILLGFDGLERFRYVGEGADDYVPMELLLEEIERLLGPDQSRHWNLKQGKPALKGYDPVAYFTEGRAVEGKPSISAQYRGVPYRFSSFEHRDRFLTNPEKYSPAYGGWCATAMAEGKQVDINPKSFQITDGRLFLFYDGLWGNARKDWLEDESALRQRADAAWQSQVAP